MTPKLNTEKIWEIVDAETGRVYDSFYHKVTAVQWCNKYKRTLLIDLKVRRKKQ